MADNNDFGFTFEDDYTGPTTDELTERDGKISQLEADFVDLKATNREIIKKITVLMNNLKKNPEKDIIKWPNRVEAIDKFLADLNELHNPKKDNKL